MVDMIEVCYCGIKIFFVNNNNLFKVCIDCYIYNNIYVVRGYMYFKYCGSIKNE